MSSAEPGPGKLPLGPPALYGSHLPWAGTCKAMGMTALPERLGPSPWYRAAFVSFSLWEIRAFGGISGRPSSPSSSSISGQKVRGGKLHGPSFLSSFWFPRFLSREADSRPSGEALWTPSPPGRPASLRRGDGNRVQSPRLTARGSAEPDSSFCLRGSWQWWGVRGWG